jgi:hypothetical protein
MCARALTETRNAGPHTAPAWRYHLSRGR